MARPRHPVTVRIDEAVDLLERHGQPLTLDDIRVNVKKRLTWNDFSSEEALDAVVDIRLARRLKDLGVVAVDADGSGERKLFDDCTLAEFDEQITIKQRNVTYVANRLRVDKAVREFLAEKQAMADHPVTVGEFREQIEAIYAEHEMAA